MSKPDVWGLLEEAKAIIEFRNHPTDFYRDKEMETFVYNAKAALALREQYVLVPREPTREMLCAWRDNEGTDEYFESGQGIGICYRAMLAAAEQPKEKL